MSYSTSTDVTRAAVDMFGALKERAQLAVVYFTDVERALVKATNRDLVVPKEKHVQLIISASWERGINLQDMFKQIDARIREPFWAVSLKTLIVVHYLMREGDSDRVMGYMANNASSLLNMSGYRDTSSGSQGMEQTSNIKMYATYLEEKVAVYRELKYDLLRDGKQTSALLTMSWNDGLFKHVSSVQRQIGALLDCHFYLDSINNDITTEALRLLVKDLMKLYQLANEGTINLLQLFFTLPKTDAMRALELYKTFVLQTRKVIEYLDMARKLQYGLGMTIPELAHAPLSLASNLEDYLYSPEFEVTRAATIAKKNAGGAGNQAPSVVLQAQNMASKSVTPSSAPVRAASGNNLMIDIFAPQTAPATQVTNQNISNTDFFASMNPSTQIIVSQPPSNQIVVRQPTNASLLEDNFFAQPVSHSGTNSFVSQRSNLSQFVHQPPVQSNQGMYMQQQYGASSHPVLPSQSTLQQPDLQQMYQNNSNVQMRNTSVLVGDRAQQQYFQQQNSQQQLFSAPATQQQNMQQQQYQVAPMINTGMGMNNMMAQQPRAAQPQQSQQLQPQQFGASMISRNQSAASFSSFSSNTMPGNQQSAFLQQQQVTLGATNQQPFQPNFGNSQQQQQPQQQASWNNGNQNSLF